MRATTLFLRTRASEATGLRLTARFRVFNNARDDSQLPAFCPWRGSADAASTHAADRDSSSSTLKMPHRSLLEAMAAITVLKSCRQSHQDQLPAQTKQRVLSLHRICAMYQQHAEARQRQASIMQRFLSQVERSFSNPPTSPSQLNMIGT